MDVGIHCIIWQVAIVLDGAVHPFTCLVGIFYGLGHSDSHLAGGFSSG